MRDKEIHVRCPGTGRKPTFNYGRTKKSPGIDVGACPDCPGIVALRPGGTVSIHEPAKRGRLSHFEKLTKGAF